MEIATRAVVRKAVTAPPGSATARLSAVATKQLMWLRPWALRARSSSTRATARMPHSPRGRRLTATPPTRPPSTKGAGTGPACPWAPSIRASAWAATPATARPLPAPMTTRPWWTGYASASSTTAQTSIQSARQGWTGASATALRPATSTPAVIHQASSWPRQTPMASAAIAAVPAMTRPGGVWPRPGAR